MEIYDVHRSDSFIVYASRIKCGIATICGINYLMRLFAIPSISAFSEPWFVNVLKWWFLEHSLLQSVLNRLLKIPSVINYAV